MKGNTKDVRQFRQGEVDEGGQPIQYGWCPTCVQPSISSIYLPDLPPSSLSNRSQSCTGCTQGRGKYLDSSHTWSQFPRLAASPGLRGSSGQSRVLSAAETFWASLNLHRVSLGPAPGPYCASAGAGGWPCQLVVPRWCPGGRGGPRAGRPVSTPGSSLSLSIALHFRRLHVETRPLCCARLIL